MPARAQLGDDRRGRAVRVGDDGRVDGVPADVEDLELQRHARARVHVVEPLAGLRPRGHVRELEERVAVEQLRGDRAGVADARRGRRPQPRSSPSSFVLTASTIFSRCGAISSSVSVRSPARNSSRTASEVWPSRA